MTEPVLLVEPRGSASRALSRLAAKRLRSTSDIRHAFGGRMRRAIWVAPSTQSVVLLLTALMGRTEGAPGRATSDQRLLSLAPANGGCHGLLHVIFRFVVSADEGVQLLPSDELAEALGSSDREDLFVGGAIAAGGEAIILYRGNLEPVVVPFTWFRSAPRGPRPDMARLAIADHGQTVRLGDYEVAADAILYEFDKAFRARARRRQVERDRSFGGALRRLRLEKNLLRTDFPGVTAKEIARIERGEVARPHPRTLNTLAKRLGVAASEIATY